MIQLYKFLIIIPNLSDSVGNLQTKGKQKDLPSFNLRGENDIVKKRRETTEITEEK